MNMYIEIINNRQIMRTFVFTCLLLLGMTTFAQDANFHVYLCLGQSNMEGNAKVEEQDRVMGLLSGGDDYVLKPFSLKELDARIIAHLKREERLHRKKEQRFYGELVIDYASKCVHIKGNALELTKLEYEIIEFLSMNPEMVFDKERIYEKIGGYDAEGDSRVVTELIRRIRKKMKMYSEHEYIATVWGRGYKWAK